MRAGQNCRTRGKRSIQSTQGIALRDRGIIEDKLKPILHDPSIDADLRWGTESSTLDGEDFVKET
jgi:hypothetical protein